LLARYSWAMASAGLPHAKTSITTEFHRGG
jgi:hypothetical protein